MHKYRRMTYEDRCQIQAFLQVEITQGEIAERLCLHKSTICREIGRNNFRFGYRAKAANKRALRNKSRCRRKYKITGELEGLVLKTLKLGWSPEQISGRLDRIGTHQVSHQTIYDYIFRNYDDLGSYLRRFQKRGGGRYTQRRNRLNCKKLWISKRPKSVEKRNRIGDWERDTMFVAQQKQILVCADRKARLVKLTKSDYRIKKTSERTWSLIKSTGKKAYTITNDNGPEFRDGPNMKVPVYFCQPQKPQQRGTIENMIGLLRQYFKRSTAPTEVTSAALRKVETLLNNRPRRCLDYRTPFEVFYGKRVALAI